MASHSVICAVLAVLLIARVAAASGAHGRRLLNPIYEEETKVNGPGKPTFKYKAAPAPAEYVSETKVRSEKPYVIVNHKEPGQKVQVEGQTTVETTEGAKFSYKSGKGGKEYKFNSGKRAFEVNVNRKATVNLPTTDVTVSGGEPLAVRHYTSVTGPIPNTTATFASGDGPKYSNTWAVNVGPGSGRRLLAALRRWAHGQ